MTVEERLAWQDAEDSGLEPEIPARLRPSSLQEATDAKRATADKLAWIEQLTLDSGLSRGGLRVGLRIASYLNRQNGQAWPAQTTLSDELDVQPRGIRYAIRELIERGHMVAVRPNRQKTNRYRPILFDRKHSILSDTAPRGKSPACQAIDPERMKSVLLRGSRASPNTLEEPSDSKAIRDSAGLGRLRSLSSASVTALADHPLRRVG